MKGIVLIVTIFSSLNCTIPSAMATWSNTFDNLEELALLSAIPNRSHFKNPITVVLKKRTLPARLASRLYLVYNLSWEEKTTAFLPLSLVRLITASVQV